MRIKGLILSVGVATLLSLAGCGGETSQRTGLVAEDTKSVLNQDNYVNLAKYYYLQETRDRHVMKSRSMEHLNSAKKSRGKKDINALYVKSNKTDDGTIKSMIVQNNNSLVSVSVDGESVKVTLHGGANEATQTLTLSEFRSFDIDQSMVNEGEGQ